MSVELECPACGQVIRAKSEFAGRKIRCPACQQLMRLPGTPTPAHPRRLLDVDDEPQEELVETELVEERAEVEEELTRPKKVAPKKKSQPKKRGKKKDDTPWAVTHWHWLVSGALLFCSLLGVKGAGIALLGIVGGAIGIFASIFIPLVRQILEDPETELRLMLSPGARIRMAGERYDHPYKVRTRRAFRETGRLAWKCLFIIVFSALSLFVNRALQ